MKIKFVHWNNVSINSFLMVFHSFEEFLTKTYFDILQGFSLGPAMSPGGIVMSVFVCMLVITLFGWVGYAYFNPNTSSGRFLIKVTHVCSQYNCFYIFLYFSIVQVHGDGDRVVLDTQLHQFTCNLCPILP